MRVIRGRGRGRGRGGAAGGRGRGRGATLGHTGGTRTPRRDQNPQETELYTPALEQQRLDEARARDNPNSTRTTRNGTVLETRNAGVNAAPEVAAPEARGMAARIVREAVAENHVEDFFNDQGITDHQGGPKTGRPPFTIVQNLMGCDFGETKAKTVAQELFVNEYISCKNMSETTLFHRIKTITRNQDNPVHLTGRDETYIQAFIFWVKEKLLLGKDPSSILFPPDLVGTINERFFTHKKYLAQCIRDGAGYKPDKFTKDMRWRDWADEYLNYLKFCPGTDGIPLSYVIRDDNTPNPPVGDSFLKVWVATAPHYGITYGIDSESVHTSLTKSISGHDEAEAAIQAVKYHNDGRAVWTALVTYFEGQGIYAYDFTQAEDDFYTLKYTGEKPPTMDWKEFERRLRSMFLVYDKRFRANYHHQQHRLSILLRKIQCEWLKETLTFIRVAASSVPPTTTFEGALTSFRCAVQARHPPTSGIFPVRRIKAVASTQGPWKPNRGLHAADKIVKLSGGGTSHYHVSYWFTPPVFRQLSEDQQQACRDHRASKRNPGEGNRTDNTKRTIQQLETENLQLRATAAAENLSALIPDSVSLDDQLSVITKSYISQVSQAASQATKSSIMGGRNEQAFKRSKNN